MKSYAFFFDSSSCSGCKTCQAACRDKNDLPSGVNWRRVYDIQGGDWEGEGGIYHSYPFGYFLSVSCMNCGNAPCITACPTKALARNDYGIVDIDESLCIGCRYCEWNCPYGAPQFNPEKKVVTKCNLCQDYLAEARKPACVTSCPMRALDFGSYDEISGKYGNTASVFPLPDPGLADPGFVIKKHPDSIRTEKEAAFVSDREDI